jgi:hypothetical protein
LTGYNEIDVSDISKKLSILFPTEVAEKLACASLLDEGEDLNELLKLSEMKIAMSKKTYVPPPEPEKSSGDIVLGRVLRGDQELHPFHVSLEDINRHIAIFSSTGMGKTTLIINMLLQLLNHEEPIPFLATDWKQDLRHLIRKHPLLVLRWEWLKINFLQPPKGASKKHWMMIIADIFAHVFGFFSASENYMMQFMDRLYKEHKEGYPTLQELYEAIENREEKSRRYIEYQDVVKNRLASMLIVLKEVVDCSMGFPLEELLEQPLVIELDGLRRDEANFIVEYLLAYIFVYRMANRHRGSLRHVIIFDEATRVFYKKREWRETTIELGLPFIETVPQIIRDYTEGITFALQEPNAASHSLLANTSVKVVGFLGEGSDINAIAESLDLTNEERSAITKLERGQWLVKKAGMDPFLMRSSDYPLEKDVSDEELLERMGPFLSRLDSAVVPASQQHQDKPAEPELPTLSEDADKLLLNANEHPFAGLSSRYRMLNFSGERAQAAKEELVRKSLVKEVDVVLGKHRPVRFLVITDLGLNYLGSFQRKTDLWDYVGHVSFEHRLYQVLIAYHFRKLGHQAFIEKDLGEERRLDVLVVNGRKKIGIEIELNSNFDLKKILKSMKDLDELVVLCKDQAVLNKIEQRVQEVAYPSLRKRITIQTISEYLSNISNIHTSKDGNQSNYSEKNNSSSELENKLGNKEKKQIGQI